MGNECKNGKVPLISKIAYGFGDVGCNFSWMFVSNFLMIFYTDVFGISMAAVSALMLFSRFWDAINDPIVGGLTDKTKTKWGRYRPWLLIAAPITAVLLIMTFWAHPDWSDRSKVIYMVITYCLLVLGYTCVNIPYGTLCGAMTQDIDERAKINTSRSVSAMVAIGIINIITVPLIEKLGSQSAKTGYLLVAIIYGCIFAACHFFCFAKTKEQVIMPEKEKISIKVQLRAVMQNRPYILALIGQVLFGFTLYGRNADVLYYFTYVEGNASYYTTYSMCIIIPSIIGAACFQPVFRKLNNKGRTASIFALFPGISMLCMFFFNVKETPAVFYTLAGPEISVATTKAYSAQLAAMYCLAVQFAKVRGKISEEQYSYYISEMLTIPDKMQKVLEDKERIQWFASKYANAHDVFFVGRGIDYAVCLEGSLKLKEISYIHSEAYAAGELKHGTISLIEQGTLVIGVLTQSELYEKTISNMLECKSRGAYLMGLTTYGKYEIEDQVNFTVYVPKVDEHFVGSLAVVPLQLIGYYVSVAKGLDVDKPRNLAKSVTVE